MINILSVGLKITSSFKIEFFKEKHYFKFVNFTCLPATVKNLNKITVNPNELLDSSLKNYFNGLMSKKLVLKIKNFVFHLFFLPNLVDQKRQNVR